MRWKLKLCALQIVLLVKIQVAFGATSDEGKASKGQEVFIGGQGHLSEDAKFVKPLDSIRAAHSKESIRRAKRYVDDLEGKQDTALSDVNFEIDDENRYIGHCKSAYILMWPGNSRKFWSYGYVYLKEPYLANCTMVYYYNTRRYPNDDFCKFGFRVRGWFYGIDEPYTHCTETDYVYLTDSNGNDAYYCGDYTEIDWITAEDSFEFHFVTKEDSARARGFFTWIESYKLCGGLYAVYNVPPTGTFTTPLYPDNYPGNVACHWYFDTPVDEGHEVSTKISCSAFALEAMFTNGTHEICLDAVKFSFEAPYSSETQTYCSDALDNHMHTIYSTHHPLLISFSTNDATSATGFNCTYEFILYGE